MDRIPSAAEIRQAKKNELREEWGHVCRRITRKLKESEGPLYIPVCWSPWWSYIGWNPLFKDLIKENLEQEGWKVEEVLCYGWPFPWKRPYLKVDVDAAQLAMELFEND